MRHSTHLLYLYVSIVLIINYYLSKYIRIDRLVFLKCAEQTFTMQTYIRYRDCTNIECQSEPHLRYVLLNMNINYKFLYDINNDIPPNVICI